MSDAAEKYFPLLYEELRRLARAKLAGGGRNTVLDTHALLHESFLRLQQAGHAPLNDREHFLAYAAKTMRNVIVDEAREHLAQRRGGDLEQVTLDTIAAASLAADEPDAQVLAMHDALARLEQIDPVAAEVVELRYFGGYTETEIAEALDVTERTVRRDWEKARLLLLAALK